MVNFLRFYPDGLPLSCLISIFFGVAPVHKAERWGMYCLRSPECSRSVQIKVICSMGLSTENLMRISNEELGLKGL